MTLGEKIRAAREDAGITQEELGKLCGTTKQTIYKYETGVVTNIPLDRIEKIAAAIGVTAAFLLGWDEPSPSCESQPSLSSVIIQQYGAKVWADLNLYLQLDTEDRAEIRGAMKQMLRSDKYSFTQEYKNA